MNSSQALIDFQNYSVTKLNSIFSTAQKLKRNHNPSARFDLQGTCFLMFYEPSTRTKFSFETAALRAGFQPLSFFPNATSVEKGESLLDTLLNLETYSPHVFIIRCGEDLDLKAVQSEIKTPIFNAGWGTQGHPTQALLDVFTMEESFKSIEGKKILFVGDVAHSRVFASHIELAKILKYEVGICGPRNLLNQYTSKVTSANLPQFTSLAEGTDWADVVCFLRFQFERHAHDKILEELTQAEYHQKYGASTKWLSQLPSQKRIMHPGPVNVGIEMCREAMQDTRSLILEQSRNGVFIREAVMRSLHPERV